MGMPLRPAARALAPSQGWFPAGDGRPAVVELVGPAGAGKTAVLAAIRGRDPGIRAGLSIDRRRFAPLLARHSLALLPMSLELLARRPRSWWPAFKYVLRLRTLPAALAHEAAAGYRAIVLDEGPIFSLTRLSVFQDASRGPGRLTREWHGALLRWIDWLDAIVWLDAHDPVLVRRIREREKPHQIKTRTDVEAARFLRRYRQAFRHVLEPIRAAGRARVIEIDTTSLTADQAAAAVLAALPAAEARPPRGRDR